MVRFGFWGILGSWGNHPCKFGFSTPKRPLPTKRRVRLGQLYVTWRKLWLQISIAFFCPRREQWTCWHRDARIMRIKEGWKTLSCKGRGSSDFLEYSTIRTLSLSNLRGYWNLFWEDFWSSCRLLVTNPKELMTWAFWKARKSWIKDTAEGFEQLLFIVLQKYAYGRGCIICVN